MSARLIASVSILIAAVCVCTNWWITFTGKSPRTQLNESTELLLCLFGPFVPYLSVKLTVGVVGQAGTDLMYWIWITILAGCNTTVSGIVLDAAHASSRMHAIFSRFLLVIDLLNIFWIYALFSPDALYHLWHTDRTYLYGTTIFTQMTPHIAVNIGALGLWADQHLPLHLGVTSAWIVNGALAYYGIKCAYTPSIRDKYRKQNGGPTEVDTTQYEKLRKTAEL